MERVDLRAKRELNNGFGETLNRAFELALIPVLFALPGWLLDSWVGTTPLFALLTGGFGLAGVVAKIWIQYSEKMDQEQAKLPGAARRAQPTSGLEGREATQ